jgi:hypothetical protein
VLIEAYQDFSRNINPVNSEATVSAWLLSEEPRAFTCNKLWLSMLADTATRWEGSVQTIGQSICTSCTGTRPSTPASNEFSKRDVPYLNLWIRCAVMCCARVWYMDMLLNCVPVYFHIECWISFSITITPRLIWWEVFPWLRKTLVFFHPHEVEPKKLIRKLIHQVFLSTWKSYSLPHPFYFSTYYFLHDFYRFQFRAPILVCSCGHASCLKHSLYGALTSVPLKQKQWNCHSNCLNEGKSGFNSPHLLQF